MKHARIIIGIAAWTAVVALLWWSVDARLVSGGSIRSDLAPELWNYAVGARNTAELEMPQPTFIAVGDPIFVADGAETFRQVGEVTALVDSGRPTEARQGKTLRARVLFYSNAPELGRNTEVVFHTADDSLAWVLQTMLPPEKRKQIAAELSRTLQDHRAEIMAALQPLVEESFREALVIVEEDLAAAIERHRPEWERLGERYQRELVEREIVPLVKEEIWPIVRRHAEPTANKIGLRIWERVSLWRFTWRYLYDVSPLPQKNQFRQEWERFLEQEALPEIEQHTDEIVEVVQRIVADTVRNEQVQSAVRKNLGVIAGDPELQALVWQIVKEVAIENPRLRAALEKQWTGPEARRAFDIAGDRLEPAVRRIGALLVGTREDGVTPEFAQVLRRQILHKDRRWFLLEANPESTDTTAPRPRAASEVVVLPVRRGQSTSASPFVPVHTKAVNDGHR